MKFATLALIGITMLAGCSRRGDARLIGTWQSDADKTIAQMKTTRTITEGPEAVLRKYYGHIKKTFTPTTYTMDANGAAGRNEVETVPYTIVHRDGDSITIKYRKNNKDLETKILFDGSDGFWQAGDDTDKGEYYKRIN